MKRPALKSRKFYYLVLGILIFGFLMVFNASPLYSQRLFNNPYHIAQLQLIWTFVGLLFFLVVSFLNLNLIKKVARGFFLTSLVLLFFLAAASVFYPCRKVISPESDIAFCPCKNGARRWVNLNPLPLPQFPLLGTLGFQASDLAKLALVVYIPLVIESRSKSAKSDLEPFIHFGVYCFTTSMLILAQPNMSNAILIVLMGVVMYFISGLELKPLFALAPVVLVLGLIFILISPYRRERFDTLFSPEKQSAQGELYQSEQILIGLGTGGFFGVGVGQSIQKQHYIPEVIGDSIFAIIGEEMGFVGSVLVIIGFAMLTLEMVKISAGATTQYEKMLGMGVCAWIFFQYLINLYSTVKLITPTGMPIPFISYGGSSMIFALAGLGLISNIYRRQNKC